MEIFESKLEGFLRRFLEETLEYARNVPPQFFREILVRATRTESISGVWADAGYLSDGEIKIKFMNGPISQAVYADKLRISLGLESSDAFWLRVELIGREGLTQLRISSKEASVHFPQISEV